MTTSAELKELIRRRYNPDHLVSMSHEGIMAYAQLVTAYHLALANERVPLYNYSWPANPGLTTWPSVPNGHPYPNNPTFPATITCKKPIEAGMTLVSPTTIQTTPCTNAKSACQVDEVSRSNF